MCLQYWHRQPVVGVDIVYVADCTNRFSGLIYSRERLRSCDVDALSYYHMLLNNRGTVL